MRQLDEKKLAKLKTTNQLLDEKYGKHGTSTREEFNFRIAQALGIEFTPTFV